MEIYLNYSFKFKAVKLVSLNLILFHKNQMNIHKIHIRIAFQYSYYMSIHGIILNKIYFDYEKPLILLPIINLLSL